jgi:hypothetical protein
MNKPEVGQEVYIGENPHAVTKVGRKYFYIGEGWKELKVDLEDWRVMREPGYGKGPQVYADLQEYQDAQEYGKLLEDFGKLFSRSYGKCRNLSLQQLRDIKKIIGDNDE